ncbi:MAG: hypothetical protein ACTSU3_11550 [Candidatus Thorarchaeota archaeon]
MQINIFRLLSDPGSNMLLLAGIFFSSMFLLTLIKWRKGRPSIMRILVTIIGYAVFSFGLGMTLPYLYSPAGPGMPMNDVAVAGGVVTIIGLVIIVSMWCAGGSIASTGPSHQKTGIVRIRTIEQVSAAASDKGILVHGGDTPIIRCPKCNGEFEVTPEMMAARDLLCLNCGKEIDL